MSDTFEIPGGDPDAMAWAHDHDLDPFDFTRRVTLHDDGTVELERFQRDAEGKTMPSATRRNAVATEPVKITPKRPFPTERRVVRG